mmetsp:Transcript_36881/g.82928  ORF Transcript_36881/g.82928 Transcript_36881/m.82928 type:complete len:224 (+) Transcript_36881:88-759(+)
MLSGLMSRKTIRQSSCRYLSASATPLTASSLSASPSLQASMGRPCVGASRPGRPTTLPPPPTRRRNHGLSEPSPLLLPLPPEDVEDVGDGTGDGGGSRTSRRYLRSHLVVSVSYSGSRRRKYPNRWRYPAAADDLRLPTRPLSSSAQLNSDSRLPSLTPWSSMMFSWRRTERKRASMARSAMPRSKCLFRCRPGAFSSPGPDGDDGAAWHLAAVLDGERYFIA